HEPFDPSEAALVEARCQGCPGPDAPESTGRILRRRWQADRVELEVEASRASMLVVSQAWSDGWTAKVDGRAARVVRTDAVLQGLAVPPGRSTVVLEYRPPGLLAGAGLSVGTVAGLLFWTLVRRTRTRRPRSVDAAS
ncbi:MAG TPA: YfhO family protein, partial [Acidimicrobiales bacterium]|nr:YfhO family protein [Acidimicrobiales bacterium]